MLRGARKIVISSLFVRLIIFRGVFSYSVEEFLNEFLLKSRRNKREL